MLFNPSIGPTIRCVKTEQNSYSRDSFCLVIVNSNSRRQYAMQYGSRRIHVRFTKRFDGPEPNEEKTIDRKGARITPAGFGTRFCVFHEFFLKTLPIKFPLTIILRALQLL